MPPEVLRSHLTRQPFAPFRIHLTDGRVFDVLHPGLLWVGRRDAVVGIRGPDGYLERHHTISLLHITGVEPIQPAPAAGWPGPESAGAGGGRMGMSARTLQPPGARS